jgi:NitT/TauT family transport system substrate-binding protein
MTTINIMAMRHSAFYTPLLVTIAGGFLKDEGLEPIYTVATPDNPVTDALRDGKAHLSQSAVATSFAGLEQGEASDIVHFAQINERDGFFLAGREPEPEFKWQNLIGREVLVDHLFQPLAMFRYALHKQGIDESQIKIVDVGGVDAIDKAFREGRGDYVHQQGPAPQQMEFDGVAHVVASVGDVIGPVAFSSLCATREWLKTDMAMAFMRAYRRARQFVMDTSAEAIAAREAEFFPGIDAKVLSSTIDAYKRSGCWSKNPVINLASYETLLDVFEFNGLITKRHAIDRCVTPPPDAADV